MAADEGEGQAQDEKSPAALAEEPAATEAEAAATKEARAPRTVSAGHVRRALQEQAEDARLRVLGTRLRPHPPTPPAPAGGSGADEERDDALRRVVEDIASETARLREQADDLRSEVEKAAAS